MPVPIVLDKGKCRFDPAVGRVEVLARRVDRNELTAIQANFLFADQPLAEKPSLGMHSRVHDLPTRTPGTRHQFPDGFST
jgi:hypothetical protein